ncbi:hypothetical protein ACQ3G6_01800 [Allorhizobium undicola]|uniref:hypothetical protein n=1 Tax=Allorhizobium undicola TaxID=78527 RepID=UPI003D33BFEA
MKQGEEKWELASTFLRALMRLAGLSAPLSAMQVSAISGRIQAQANSMAMATCVVKMAMATCVVKK